jgi:hypothetical protein
VPETHHGTVYLIGGRDHVTSVQKPGSNATGPAPGPNFLIFVTDQNRWDLLGWAGGSVTRRDGGVHARMTRPYLPGFLP